MVNVIKGISSIAESCGIELTVLPKLDAEMLEQSIVQRYSMKQSMGRRLFERLKDCVATSHVDSISWIAKFSFEGPIYLLGHEKAESFVCGVEFQSITDVLSVYNQCPNITVYLFNSKRDLTFSITEE